MLHFVYLLVCLFVCFVYLLPLLWLVFLCFVSLFLLLFPGNFNLLKLGQEKNVEDRGSRPKVESQGFVIAQIGDNVIIFLLGGELQEDSTRNNSCLTYRTSLHKIKDPKLTNDAFKKKEKQKKKR